MTAMSTKSCQLNKASWHVANYNSYICSNYRACIDENVQAHGHSKNAEEKNEQLNIFNVSTSSGQSRMRQAHRRIPALMSRSFSRHGMLISRITLTFQGLIMQMHEPLIKNRILPGRERIGKRRIDDICTILSPCNNANFCRSSNVQRFFSSSSL